VETKIKRLIEFSKKVILDCSLENGSIVAANSDEKVYPKDVCDYRKVWIRDASYTCLAADILGLKKIPENFFDWCLERAEGFKETGLLWNAYNTNGAIHGVASLPLCKIGKNIKSINKYISCYGTTLQPDQYGILLIAIDHHIKHFKVKEISKYEKLIEITADGICRIWKNKRFTLPYIDLWEERAIFPKDNSYHLYSLTSCIKGLRIAISLVGKKSNLIKTEKEMSEIFENIVKKCNLLPITFGDVVNKKYFNVDSTKKDPFSDGSILGLVYPNEIIEADNPKMVSTVNRIIKKNNYDNGGLLRYPRDKYCGRTKYGKLCLTGAGAWPIVNFWMSIYYSKLGDKEKALKYYNWVLKRVKDHIPEQIFKNKKQKGIVPLCWSHAMFVLASKELGFV
jgi:GH15 family glucan-1,4-alpha-glucosidase